MKKLSLLICLAGLTLAGLAQYKNDNVLYKTVYTEDLCDELNRNPGHLLLDVRSVGEYMDTSSMVMNLGRFTNAVNIPVNDLGKQIAGISAYKDKPVFVYCSHSQRSRRAGKMLADSGFTKVFNINAGMTGIRQLPDDAYACLYNKLESGKAYRIISAASLCKKISGESKNIFLLDVRNDSAFKQASTDPGINAYGHFKNTTNIPLASLENDLSGIPKGKEIIITDLYGGDAEKAARILTRNNFGNVSVLLEGIDRVLYSDSKKLPCLADNYVSALPYTIINALELKPYMELAGSYLLLDVRTAEEFNNTHKTPRFNNGRLAGAVNIPLAELDKNHEQIIAHKNKPVIIYVNGGGRGAHEAAQTLVKNGFTKIVVLQGGLFSISWTAANIRGYEYLAALRTNVPVENQ